MGHLALQKKKSAKFLYESSAHNHVGIALYMRKQERSIIKILPGARHIVGLVTANFTEHLLGVRLRTCTLHEFTLLSFTTTLSCTCS